MEGYCMKCRGTRNMVKTEQTTMKNGRPAMLGHCEECDCKMYKIMKASE